MKKVAFKNGLLIDGTGSEAVHNALVLVEKGKITYAGPGRESIPADYEIRDITGKSIMPGLIDSHLHFSGNLTDSDTDWVMEHKFWSNFSFNFYVSKRKKKTFKI